MSEHKVSKAKHSVEQAPVNHLETMIRLSAMMNSSLEASNVRQSAIEAASTLVNCEAASLLFINPETGGLYFDVALGAGGESVKTIQLEKGEGIAGWVADRKQPLIIQDAQNDPRLYKNADKKSGFKTRSMLCVPVSTKANVLGVLQAINKKNKTFTEDDARLLSALANQIAVALENVKLYGELRESLYSVVQVLAEAIEKRDPHATGHAKRVAAYSVEIGKQMGFSKTKLVNLKLAAILHDVGMIGVPDDIMQKKTRLTEEERKEMMRHLKMGAEIIDNVKHLHHIKPAIKYHHECYNGTGPHHIKGDEIPMFARIIAVADAFDAMTSKRPYLLAKGYDGALEEIRAGAGSLYDPDVVSAFFASKSPIMARHHPLLKRRQ